MAVAADIRIAADDIRIGFNQVTLEIMPAWGGAERLAALVGRSQALLLAGSGTVLSAAEAHRIGLINRVVPRAEFDGEWRSIAQSLAHRPAGFGLGQPIGRRVVRLLLDRCLAGRVHPAGHDAVAADALGAE